TPDVDDLLCLPVRGHVEGAVPGEIVHRHDVSEPVLVDGRKRSLLVLPEERRLLLRTQLNLLASIGRHAWYLLMSHAVPPTCRRRASTTSRPSAISTTIIALSVSDSSTPMNAPTTP